jgi:hypothetical protein
VAERQADAAAATSREKKKTTAEADNPRERTPAWVSGLGTRPGMDRPSPLGTQVRINYKND